MPHELGLHIFPLARLRCESSCESSCGAYCRRFQGYQTIVVPLELHFQYGSVPVNAICVLVRIFCPIRLKGQLVKYLITLLIPALPRLESPRRKTRKI